MPTTITDALVKSLPQTKNELKHVHNLLMSCNRIVSRVEKTYDSDFSSIATFEELNNWRNNSYAAAESMFLEAEKIMRGSDTSNTAVDNALILIPPLSVTVGYGNFLLAKLDCAVGDPLIIYADPDRGDAIPQTFTGFLAGDVIAVINTDDGTTFALDDGVYTINTVTDNITIQTVEDAATSVDADPAYEQTVINPLTVKLTKRDYTLTDYTSAVRRIHTYDMLKSSIDGLIEILKVMTLKLIKLETDIADYEYENIPYETINNLMIDVYDELIALKDEYCTVSETLTVRPRIVLSSAKEIASFDVVMASDAIDLNLASGFTSNPELGFRAGDKILIQGSAGATNNGTYDIDNLSTSNRIVFLGVAFSDQTAESLTLTLVGE